MKPVQLNDISSNNAIDTQGTIGARENQREKGICYQGGAIKVTNIQFEIEASRKITERY